MPKTNWPLADDSTGNSSVKKPSLLYLYGVPLIRSRIYETKQLQHIDSDLQALRSWALHLQIRYKSHGCVIKYVYTITGRQ